MGLSRDSSKSLSSSLTRANLEQHSRQTTLRQTDLGEDRLIGRVDLAYPRLSPIRTTKEPLLGSHVSSWDPMMMSPVVIIEPTSHDMAFIADDEGSFEGDTLHGANALLHDDGFCYDDDDQWSPRSDSSDVLTLSPVSTSSAALHSRGASPLTAAKELSIISAISCGLSTLCFGAESCDHHYSPPCDSTVDLPLLSCMGGSETPPSSLKILCTRGFRKRGGGDMSPIRRLASKYPDVFGATGSPTKTAFLPPDSMDMDGHRQHGFGFCSTCA